MKPKTHPRTRWPDLLLAALAIAILVLAPMLAMAQQQQQDQEQPRQPGPPSCYPFVNGYPVGMPKLYKTADHWHVFWFCGNRQRTQVRIEGFSCRSELCSEAVFSTVMHQITRATATVRTANAAWSEHVTVNCTQRYTEETPEGAMCRDRFAIHRSNYTLWAEEVKWWFAGQ
jgi:hypothetical protein